MISGLHRCALDEVAVVFNGKTPSKAEQRLAGHPVLKIRDVDEHGEFPGSFESFVDTSFAQKFNGKLLCSGDTLLLNAAHNAAYVGSKSFFVHGSAIGALATGEWLIIRPKQQYVDPRFLFYWSKVSGTARRIGELVKGIHLYPSDVADITLDLPSVGVQRELSHILDAATAVCRVRRHALELNEGFLQAVFLEMFGDSRTRWKTRALSEMCASEDDIRCGPFGTQLSVSELASSGIPLWGITHVNCGFKLPAREFVPFTKAQTLKNYSLVSGDIVMTRKGTVGNCAVYPAHFRDGIMHSDLLRIRPDATRIDPIFLLHQLRYSKRVERQVAIISAGAVMPGVNVGLLKTIVVEVPPADMQQRFSRIAAAHMELFDANAEAVRQSDHLFHTLLEQAFGEAA